MIDNIYYLYERPYLPFLENPNVKTIDVKDFGQATLNSNKFRHKQKSKKRK